MTAWVLRAIEKHRHSRLAGRGCCRFSPTCSHYAEELFRTRAFPIALLLTTWRILRCNPIATRKAYDPVRGARRWRPRPNTVPTIFSVFALSGFVVVMTAGVAQAVGVTNGCKATINGRQPSTMTHDSPLVVHKHESVSVTGTVPPSVAAGGNQIVSNTHIQVSIVNGFFEPTTSDHPGHGPNWSGSKEVDDYLKWGVGLYKVTGVATGTSPSGGTWQCKGSGYIELRDGNALTKPVGAVSGAVILIGLLGSAAATRGGTPDVDDIQDSPEDTGSDEPVTPHTDDMDHMVAEKAEQVIVKPDPGEEGLAGAACLVLIMIAIGAAFAGSGIGAAAVAATPRRPRKTRVWAHGHPIIGFISGLLMGLGITVLLQQFAVWPLTLLTAIIFPVVVAIICGIRAYMGRPYKVVRG